MIPRNIRPSRSTATFWMYSRSIFFNSTWSPVSSMAARLLLSSPIWVGVRSGLGLDSWCSTWSRSACRRAWSVSSPRRRSPRAGLYPRSAMPVTRLSIFLRRLVMRLAMEDLSASAFRCRSAFCCCSSCWMAARFSGCRI